MPTYRNIYTGSTVTSDSPHPSFARSGRWELDSTSESADSGPPRPSESDRKADWEVYAHAIGVASPDEGDVTKAELMDRVQAHEAEGATDGAV